VGRACMDVKENLKGNSGRKYKCNKDLGVVLGSAGQTRSTMISISAPRE